MDMHVTTLAKNLWLQMALLGVVAVFLIALAAYISQDPIRVQIRRNTMRWKHIVVGAAVVSLVGTSALISQAAADTLIPLFTYRTGPFANSGIPNANGLHDYFDMLNARDGGIGGSKLVIEECETGYKNEKGV